MTAAGMNPEQVLGELRELWTNLAQDQAEAGGVLRACALTLVVTTGASADAERVRKTIGELMHNHPSRAIIVREPEAGEGNQELNARVFAECWMPFGGNRQICSEGIEITPGGEDVAMRDVARVLVPLRAPDLPLVLWRRGASSSEGGRYDALLPLADKIVFDTRRAPDAEVAIEYLRDLRAQGRRVADLHWTRLTGWREVIAHLFDDRAVPLESITSATVHYAGERLTTCALYFAAWIRSALPHAQVNIENAPATAAGGGVVAVEFGGPPEPLSVRREAPGCVEIHGAGRNYRSTLPTVGEQDLMREELGILGRDPVYDQVLSG